MSNQTEENEVLISRKFNLYFVDVDYAIKSNLKEKENQIIIGTNSARELVRFLSYLTGGDWFKRNKEKIFFHSNSEEIPIERIYMNQEDALKKIRKHLNAVHFQVRGTTIRRRESVKKAEKRWKEV